MQMQFISLVESYQGCISRIFACCQEHFGCRMGPKTYCNEGYLRPEIAQDANCYWTDTENTWFCQVGTLLIGTCRITPSLNIN